MSTPLFDQIFEGDPERTRAHQIEKRFETFHADNPRVWFLFQQFAYEMIRAGLEHYSARALFHRIRWHVAIETKTQESVKLNNDYTPLYALMFCETWPAREGFFRSRKRTSEDTPAYGTDVAVTVTENPTDDQRLRDKLRKLGTAGNTFKP